MPDFNLSLALLSEMRHYESASAHAKDPDPLPSLLPTFEDWGCSVMSEMVVVTDKKRREDGDAH